MGWVASREVRSGGSASGRAHGQSMKRVDWKRGKRERGLERGKGEGGKERQGGFGANVGTFVRWLDTRDRAVIVVVVVVFCCMEKTYEMGNEEFLREKKRQRIHVSTRSAFKVWQMEGTGNGKTKAKEKEKEKMEVEEVPREKANSGSSGRAPTRSRKAKAKAKRVCIRGGEEGQLRNSDGDKDEEGFAKEAPTPTPCTLMRKVCYEGQKALMTKKNQFETKKEMRMLTRRNQVHIVPSPSSSSTNRVVHRSKPAASHTHRHMHASERTYAGETEVRAGKHHVTSAKTTLSSRSG